MIETNTIARALHDVGLAAWFGGSLMGAIGLNTASETVSDPRERTRVADAGWAQWTPVNAAAIIAHLVGGAQLLNANKGRMATQQGVASSTAIKTGLTAGALLATACSRVLGQRIMQADQGPAQVTGEAGGGAPAQDAVTPAEQTPPEVAKAQRQLKVLQWAIPVMTGGMLMLNAEMGEQQRASQVTRGLLQRAVPGA
jgi:hypothetical protein